MSISAVVFKHRRAAWLLGTIVTFAIPAQSQVLPGAVQPGRDRVGPALPAQPDFDFSIVAPHRSAVPRAVDEVHFKLAGLKITGATTIPADFFHPFYESKIGKDVTLVDILDVADRIEAEYRKRGYLLVRAYVPPQRVKDGIFTINVVEGRLDNVTVQGGDDTTRDLIKDYLAPAVASHPVTLPAMERGLLLTNDIPGISATGVLRPSPNTPGASDLVVDVLQPWIEGGLAADNRGSRFSGLWTMQGDVEFNDIFGADQLAATLTFSPDSFQEQIAGQARYRRAIGDDGLIGSMIVTVTHGEPGSTLAAFDVLTDSWAVGPRLTYPLIRSRSETLLLDGGFTVQEANVNSLGTGLSHDNWRVLDMGGSYQRNGLLGDGSVWTSTFDVAQGLPIFGATDNHSPELSRVGGLTDFTKVTGFSRLSIPLVDTFGVVFSAQGQYSFVPLITGEQIAFGGTQIGRGYDPGAITGDHGLGGSAELRYDWRVPTNDVLQLLEPYVYIDGARTWYIQRGPAIDPSLINANIASVGGGLRYWFPYNITAGTEVARTMNAVPGSDGGRMATKFLVDLSVRY
ncbi:MAG TPA: ShlB/FhaC/HecB family hemolysin secretion/activation protein [Rhizomicrobium sp.]|nr:ShlB/FhaC/HecB family hemolysin secretion/activation protein [Rhizomicrobium sp.]